MVRAGRRFAWRLRDWGRIFWIVATMILIGCTFWAALLAKRHPDPGNLLAFVGVISSAVCAVAAIRALRKDPPDVTPDGLSMVADGLADRLRSSEGRVLSRLLDRASARIDVGFQLDPSPNPSQIAAGAGAIGSLDWVLAYYTRLSPRRLAIIGRPGSGKTVMALELQAKLLHARTHARPPRGPVPVRFSLSAWQPNRDLEAWLADELCAVYQFAPPVADALITHEFVIPILDGLDEMDSDGQQPDRAASMVKALNKWLDGGAKDAPLILTCRDELYGRLSQYSDPQGRRLINAATVRLTDLTSKEVVEYMRSRVPDLSRWQPVIANLEDKRNTALATALDTPWLLSLAMIIYKMETADDGSARLPGDLIDHTGDMHEHLLRDYVRAATEADPPKGRRPYRHEDVGRWLGELAVYLNGNAHDRREIGGKPLSGTDIVLHELWPIGGERRPRRIDTMIAALISVPGFVWLGAFAFSHSVYWRVLLLVVLAGYSAALWRVTSAFWVAPRPFNVRQVFSWRGFAQLVIAAAGGAAVAMLFNPAAGAVAGFGAWVTTGLSISPTQGLVTTIIPVTTPSSLLRGDLRLSLVSALSVAPSCGLAFSLYLGPWVGWTCGVAYAVLVGFTVASAPWRRYVALLLCTRGRLPCRLSRFLDWACDAGLLRVSGIAYQFRHREFQEWLAIHH